MKKIKKIWLFIKSLIKKILKWIAEHALLVAFVVALIFVILVINAPFVLNYFGFKFKFEFKPDNHNFFDLIEALGYVALAPFVVYGAYIAGNRWKNDSKKLENDREQLDNTIFSGAITHLGHEQKSVRMGGVYTLVELAKKNSEYKEKIFEVLNYHIVSQSSQYFEKHQKTQEEKEKTNKKEYTTSTEVQAILDLLFRNEESFQGLIANLINAKLHGADKLWSTSFQGANLTGANLTGANLQRANLIGANLQEAKLTGAKLQEAWLYGAIVPNDWVKQIKNPQGLKPEPIAKNEIKNYGRNEVILAVTDDVNVYEFMKLDLPSKLNELSKEFINQEGINFYKVTDIRPQARRIKIQNFD